MIEAIGRDGYIIAQSYVPAAAKGDIRFFLMNARGSRRPSARGVVAFAGEGDRTPRLSPILSGTPFIRKKRMSPLAAAGT